MTLDLGLVEHRMRRAYELGRVRHALSAGAPLIALTGLALYAGAQRWVDFLFALTLAGTILFYHWYGQLAENALRAGIGAGLYPLLFALAANAASPGCHHDGAFSLCTGACAIGGVLAARHLSRYSNGHHGSVRAFGFAVLPTFLLGALGCGCVGFTGVLAMALAMLVVSLPTVLRWA